MENTEQALHHPTTASTRLALNFIGKLDEISTTKKLHPGMMITLLANYNFHDKDMPAYVFNNIDFTKEWETPEDPEIAAQAVRRIKNGKVHIERTVREDIGIYKLQYNEVRGYRPKRHATANTIAIDQPFDKNKFHLGKKEVEPGIFQSEDMNGIKMDFIINRYPFAPYHFLLVPERKKNHNQYLDPKNDRHILDASWSLVKELGKGAMLGYNANGAHASVNQLHFQGFMYLRSWQLPIEKTLMNMDLKRSQPLDKYLPGGRWISKTDGIDGLCDAIAEMNARSKKEHLSYNFSLKPQGIAFFPRRHQSHPEYLTVLQKTDFTTGLAFFEMHGEIICPIKDISLYRRQYLSKEIEKTYHAAALQ